MYLGLYSPTLLLQLLVVGKAQTNEVGQVLDEINVGEVVLGDINDLGGIRNTYYSYYRDIRSHFYDFFSFDCRIRFLNSIFVGLIRC
jgi:hypothetical protein